MYLIQAVIYGMAQSIPDRTMVSDIASVFLETIYNLKSELPNGDAKH